MLDDTGLRHELIDRAAGGDQAARGELLEGYRDYLRRMVAARLDRRLAPRVDASDLVQETLATAAARLDEYLRDRRISIIGWLRGLARQRVVDAHRHHLVADRRTVTRESRVPDPPDYSALDLGRRLFAGDTSPSNNLMRREQNDRILAGLASLSARDREILVMKYLEQRSTAEVAEALGLTERGVKGRHVRALVRLREIMENEA
jgi:RNA polymerase sigma-70 factor (ECF subfamily)